MALVRCTCLARIAPVTGGGHALRVEVADPECGYVLHRLAAELPSEPAAPTS
ncbi:hypothetical protein QWY28_11285 [Nocardioides sp. SOB77]|uniref:Uncharacterized protein n=1 Tax=Nocardioides oceani TaxID=3058369 RepID=A0ABT8FG67_9ACTN|nr:hypothetical protein [Nocardioides oceani]MDN4173530.1 hypothetical protein [Nocardioides oceani]